MPPFEEIVSGVPLASAVRSVLMLIVPEPLSRRKVPPVQASESAAVEMVRTLGVNNHECESGSKAALAITGTARTRETGFAATWTAGVKTRLVNVTGCTVGADTEAAATGKEAGLVPLTEKPVATTPVVAG